MAITKANGYTFPESTDRKFCRGCETEKYVTEFSRDNARPDKLNTRCKECMYKIRKNRRENFVRGPRH